MSRMLRVELRRSAAIGTALALLVVGVLALFFAEGIGFATGWMQLAMTQRLYLVLLWPLALAAGAWQARREHRSRVAELFASTPRPRAQRAAPTLGAMAIAVVGGYLAMGVVGGLWIAGTARYLPLSVFVVTGVGALALVAAVWLGLAAGRLLPWPVTAPALGVGGLALLLLIPGATRPRGWLALVFSPIYEMNMPDAYTTVPERASAAQALWLAALTVTALLLAISGGWRSRTAAVVPLILGVVLAVAVMPHRNRYVVSSVDTTAQELVCAKDQPRVCLSRVHSGLLGEVGPGAAEGLAALAKLPGAPTRVHEDTTTYVPDVYPAWDNDVVLLEVEVGTNGHLRDRADVPVEVVTGAFASPPHCESTASAAQALAAASWLIGRPPADAEARALWETLHALPAGEAQARVVALRTAALTCSVPR
ncbi:hypothetical protein ACQP2F_31605 [Actinoplanes sp. CA-030573]|uniref:hypothetical protein n=1 Tax=Actinoplanes sp. CA-030573 TaxID=3239898 RepID=UPI003D910EFB